MTTAADALLKHGYTLGDLERMARNATFAYRRLHPSGADWTEQFELARGAVAVALYDADTVPTARDLEDAGILALGEENRQHLRTHGRDPSTPGRTNPRHAAFWEGHRVTGFPDNAIVERMALVEILPVLTKRQCDVLVAFTAAGNSQAGAAAMLGISASSVGTHLQRARETIAALWLEHETPVRRDLEQTCRNGHDRAEFGYVRQGTQKCRGCDSDNNRRYWARRRSTEVAA